MFKKTLLLLLIVFIAWIQAQEKKDASNFNAVFNTLQLDDEEVEALQVIRLPPSNSILRATVKNLRLRAFPCSKTVVAKIPKTKLIIFKDQRLRTCGYYWLYVQAFGKLGWVPSRYVNFLRVSRARKPKIFKQPTKPRTPGRKPSKAPRGKKPTKKGVAKARTPVRKPSKVVRGKKSTVVAKGNKPKVQFKSTPPVYFNPKKVRKTSTKKSTKKVQFKSTPPVYFNPKKVTKKTTTKVTKTSTKKVQFKSTPPVYFNPKKVTKKTTTKVSKTSTKKVSKTSTKKVSKTSTKKVQFKSTPPVYFNPKKVTKKTTTKTSTKKVQFKSTPPVYFNPKKVTKKTTTKKAGTKKAGTKKVETKKNLISTLPLSGSKKVKKPCNSYLRYPDFKQFDSKWKDDKIGKKSIIQNNGSLLTSLAMILNSLGTQINSQTVTPKSLNNWFNSNRVYNDKDKIKLNPLAKLGLKQIKLSKPLNRDEIRKYVCSERSVILRLKDGYVLAVGVDLDDKTFIINDPTSTARNKVDQNEVLNAIVFSN